MKIKTVSRDGFERPKLPPDACYTGGRWIEPLRHHAVGVTAVPRCVDRRHITKHRAEKEGTGYKGDQA